MLLNNNEGFLKNKDLSLAEMEDDKKVEAEIHGAMNSVELSQDELYMDINFRACELARQSIITSITSYHIHILTLKWSHEAKFWLIYWLS